ncbi:hypothetical protein GF361_00375 [Candidatus Woesearchaeota archaeon]|nr:hypothetical protein [Candidatus Woesearchaeota archaeon]
MTSLIACLSSGKGTWAHVSQLIEKQEWNNIFLVTNDFGVKNFKPKIKEQEEPPKVEYILIYSKKYLSEIIDDIQKQLKGKITDTEVALNLISGTGKEHMAVLSAVLKLGLGIRLISLTPKGVKEV